MMLVLCLLAAVVSAQITFSKDWQGGKRSPPAVFDCSQFTRICNQFVHGLRQTLPSDNLCKRRRSVSPYDSEDNIAYE